MAQHKNRLMDEVYCCIAELKPKVGHNIFAKV